MLEHIFRAGEEEIRIPINWSDLESYSLFGNEPPKVLYHYTDLNGARGIIDSKSLHLTKIQYLNDYSELNHAINEFRVVADGIYQKIQDSEKKELLKRASEQLDAFRNTNICVACFCQDGNLLSQWRGYGGSKCGVALGFSRESLRKILSFGTMNLWRCIYDSEDQHKIIHSLINRLFQFHDTIKEHKEVRESWEQAINFIIMCFNTMFLRVAPILKNYQFREEKEWRIVTTPVDCRNNKYRAYVGNDRVLQYLALDFAISEDGKCDILNEIVVGPSENSELVRSALDVSLLHNCYSCVSTGLSLIPYGGR